MEIEEEGRVEIEGKGKESREKRERRGVRGREGSLCLNRAAICLTQALQ